MPSYLSGTINIPSVTGNVVITAVGVIPTLSSITATFDQGSVKFYPSSELIELTPYLTVAANYSDGSRETIDYPDYSLSGTLSQGTRTITVSYSGRTATFTVVVSANSLVSISALFEQGSAVIYTSAELADLRPYLTVTAHYADGSNAVVTRASTLRGNLTVAGQCTIYADYGGLTTSFTVVVTANSLTSISALFQQGSAVIYTSAELADLRPYLTVTAHYADGSDEVVTQASTLRGNLTVAGQRTIYVDYGGLTTSFTVYVTSIALSSITAVFDQGSNKIYPSDSLDTLKQYLTVTASYSDSTTQTVPSTDYTLSGTLASGVRTITVSYGGKTTTFTVVVTEPSVTGITSRFNQVGYVVYPDTNLDELKSRLTVTAEYDDGSTVTLQDNEYSLIGTLQVGTSYITIRYYYNNVLYSSVCSVNVTERPTVTSISASFNPGSTTIYSGTPVNDLKQYLTVTASYSDSTTQTVPSGDYTLSGTVDVGTNTITVSYGGKTATFNVTAVPSPSDMSTSYTSSLSGNTLTLTLNRYESQLNTSVSNEVMTATVRNS